MARKRKETPDNETRQRILDAAEGLFTKRGYTSVSLRDLAEEVGMRHASLYYYLPGGKEELYIEVIKRNYERHRLGMEQVMEQAGPDLREKLRAVAGWLLTQPPMELMYMHYSDTPKLDPERAKQLSFFAVDTMVEPLLKVLERGNEEGSLRMPNPGLAAISFIALVDDLHRIPAEFDTTDRTGLAEEIIDMLLLGWYKR